MATLEERCAGLIAKWREESLAARDEDYQLCLADVAAELEAALRNEPAPKLAYGEAANRLLKG